MGCLAAREQTRCALGGPDPRADRGSGLACGRNGIHPAAAGRHRPRPDRRRHGCGRGHDPRGASADDPRHGHGPVRTAGDRRRLRRRMGAAYPGAWGSGRCRSGARHLVRGPDPVLRNAGGYGDRARRRRSRRCRGMICETIDAFAMTLPKGHPIMGLDLGTKTIGVAISDRLLSVGTPTETIKRKKFSADATRLLEIATDRDVAGLVLGLPRNMDGSEGPRCQSTRAFARNLEGLTDLPITFWDERLSTVAAERALLEADTTRKRRAEVIDNVAASYILQGVLDRMTHMRAAQ